MRGTSSSSILVGGLGMKRVYRHRGRRTVGDSLGYD